ncbi:efflux RND transporter periplasmic adaptor subunit [Polycladidibacter hongkongensis]|uniref:efflux RND transporter periplasmic adaptor subunit n=1 Tax=Polycladidibacter hongkongensis TaxID=1647556 RepID=UPI00082FCD8B|nr:efflux RND transporter periplasmic adaptor subunit [Pseudovibrio hongkongensis]
MLTRIKKPLGSVAVIFVATYALLFVSKPALFDTPQPAFAAIGLQLWPQQAAAKQNGASKARAGARGTGRAVLVRTQPVSTATTDSFVRAIGTGRALRKTDLYAESTGRIVELPKSSGDRVAKGEVILQLDDRAERLALQQAQLALADTEDQLARYEKLITSQTISSVQLQTARLTLSRAQLDVEKAQLDLERRQVKAPFAGTLGIYDVVRGDFINQSSRIVGLDDRSKIQVEFVVPERFSAQLELGQAVKLSTPVLPGKTLSGTISELAGRIDPLSRTLTVRATSANPQEILQSGLTFDVEVPLQGTAHLAVPPMAVHWDKIGPYLWKISGDKVSRVDITIIDRGAFAILIDAPLKKGEEVVTETARTLRQGMSVKLQNSGSAPQEPSSAS